MFKMANPNHQWKLRWADLTNAMVMGKGKFMQVISHYVKNPQKFQQINHFLVKYDLCRLDNDDKFVYDVNYDKEIHFNDAVALIKEFWEPEDVRKVAELVINDSKPKIVLLKTLSVPNMSYAKYPKLNWNMYMKNAGVNKKINEILGSINVD